MSTDLRAPTFDEEVAVDNYKEASKGALGSADSTADKIAAAAFSFATAYGAVIALVAPEETPAPLVAAIPFALFALAVGLALYAQSLGLGLAGTSDLGQLRSAVANLVKGKRLYNRLALVALVLGVLVAGLIVRDRYAEPAKASSPVAVQVWLTTTGGRFVSSACDAPGKRIAGTVADADALSAERVALKVGKRACPAGESTLYLSQRQIAGAKQRGA